MEHLKKEAILHIEPSLEQETWWLPVDMSKNGVVEIPDYDFSDPEKLADQIVNQFQFGTEASQLEAKLFLAEHLKGVDFSAYGQSTEALRDFIYEMF